MRPLGILLLGTIVGLLSSCSAIPRQQPLPSPTPKVDRLAAPPIPDNPSQADRGAQVYYQVCMACHGDRGQGLTDEWRAEWGEDGNCWQQDCHGLDHPPEGFNFPDTCCRPVIGDGTLASFRNALELHAYLVETMPWWNPGYLQPEEYWQLTAFLLRAHRALPEKIEIDESNAYILLLKPSSPIPDSPATEVMIVCAILGLVVLLIFIEDRGRG